MNVYNSSDYLNAMADGVSVEYFHNWLAKPEQADAIVTEELEVQLKELDGK